MYDKEYKENDNVDMMGFVCTSCVKADVCKFRDTVLNSYNNIKYIKEMVDVLNIYVKCKFWLQAFNSIGVIYVKFTFGDIVIVEGRKIGVVVECFEVSAGYRYEVYVRLFHGTAMYDETDIKKYEFNQRYIEE